MRHWFIAALRDTAGICYFLQLAFFHSQFLQSGRKPYLLDEIRQGIDACQSQLFVGFSVAGNPTHIPGKAGKLGQPLFVNMTVIHRMDHYQTAAVVAVGVCSYLVLHVAALKVALFAPLNKAVFRHGRIPHQV